MSTLRLSNSLIALLRDMDPRRSLVARIIWLMIALAALTIAAPAMAQTWTTTRFGNTTMTYGTDRHGGTWYGTRQHFGNMTTSTIYGPNGRTRTCNSVRFGWTRTTNCY